LNILKQEIVVTATEILDFQCGTAELKKKKKSIEYENKILKVLNMTEKNSANLGFISKHLHLNLIFVYHFQFTNRLDIFFFFDLMTFFMI
jgi:hypothetical protein